MPHLYVVLTIILHTIASAIWVLLVAQQEAERKEVEMGKGTFVCVARDIAPSRAFEMLGPILEKRHFAVNLLVGDGKPLSFGDDEIVKAVSEATTVLLGMSSSAELAQAEIQIFPTHPTSHAYTRSREFVLYDLDIY